MWSIGVEIVRILYESAVYLLLGFALAGLLHVALSRTNVLARLLGGRGIRPVFLAALFGVPLPLCSCGVLPAGLALHRKGASKGATTAFLISTPETDIVSILLTYGLLGPVMAIFRPLAALITAIVGGLAVNFVDGRLQRRRADSLPAQAGTSAPVPSPPTENEQSCTCPPQPRGVIREAWHYGFGEFFDDIVPSLALGIALGGVISACLPDLGLGRFTGGSLWTMLAMLAIGIPMYVCASASTPIAVGLIAGGVSPGAALVFLLSGPATNVASLVVLYKQLGRPVVAAYLISIALVSLLMGYWLDAALATSALALPAVAAPLADGSVGPVKGAAAVVLVLLSVASLRRTRWLEQTVQRVNARTGLRFGPRGVTIGTVVVLLATYLGSGFFTVGPGERGIVTRFGRITAAALPPGLHYHWPYPFGGRDLESVGRVKWVELGFRRSVPVGKATAAAADELTLARESWLLTGNEDIIDIKWVVQYRVVDTRDGLLNYVYGLGDKGPLVRGAAEWAIRAATGSRNIDTLLTTERGPLAEAVQRDLQAALDACAGGIRVVQVALLDVHAPPDVHHAFRDVASAAEDKLTEIHLAYEHDERTVREARGEAVTQVLGAEGRAFEMTARATSDGRAFQQQVTAYVASPVLTRLRLWLETLDAVLPRVRKVVNLSAAQLDLWLVGESAALPAPLPTPERRRPENQAERRGP